VQVNGTFCAAVLQLDNSDTYAGSAFSLREAASVNHCGQHVNSRSVSGSSPWQPRSRPVFSSAAQSPCYNGFRETVAGPRFSTCRTPFSYGENPPEMMKSPCRPTAATVVGSKVCMFFANRVVFSGFLNGPAYICA